MYITSDLFSAATTHNASGLNNHISNNKIVPTMAIAPQLLGPSGSLGKRKRKGEAAESTKQSALLSVSIQCCPCSRLMSCRYTTASSMHDSLPEFSLLPPPELAVQTINASPHRAIIAAPETLSLPTHPFEPPRHHKMRRRMPMHFSKFHRVALSEAVGGNKMGSRVISKLNSLEPCHVCKTSPKQKSDLDAYSDCERCNRRICLICSRICLGDCGRKKMCSGCCEERGIDGDTWCLDCLGHHKDLDMHE